MPVASLRMPLLALALAVGGCQSTVVGPGDDEDPPPGGVTFSADVRPLFASTCGPCHTSQTTNGVNLSSHAATLASIGSQYGEAVVKPGDAAGSPLVDKIEASPRLGARMPQGQSPLSAPQIATVRAWIDAGALDS